MNEPARHCCFDSILMSDPRRIILENWATDVCKGSVYLDGNVHGHQRIADGTRIRTARVAWMLDDVGVAHTAGVRFRYTAVMVPS